MSQSAATVDVAGDGGQVDGGPGVREQPLEADAALGLGQIPHVAAIHGQQIEGDEGGRRFLRQPGHPRGGRMEAQLQGIEVEPRPGRDHDLAVDHTAAGQPFEKNRVQFGEVTVEGAAVAALDEHVITATRGPKNDGPEAVPLGFVEERAAGGKRLGDPGEHRLDGGLDGKAHLPSGRGDQGVYRPPHRRAPS